MKIYSEDDKFDERLIFNAPQSCDRETYERIESLSSPDRDPDLSNQAFVFGNIGHTAWSEYTTTSQAEEIESYFSGDLFEYLTEKSIEKFALKISENVRAFDFGYDPNAKTTTSSLDHNEYGGTEKNPAFYVTPPKYAGWMGIYDKLIPPVECGLEPALNFNSISQKTVEYNNKLKDDPRLDIPASCALDSERPFDRIMPRASLAGTDGAIRSTVRLYVMEAFLKGLPSFSLFDPKFPQVYNDTLLSYISANIKEGLLNTGLNFRKPVSRERYYYTFLEEVVQNFGKKVDLEMIVPSAAQLSAMETINNLQEKWRKPSRKPRINYKKRLKDKWISNIKSVESSCSILLNYYISEQLTEIGKLFSDTLKPSIPNLESWFFGSPTWMSAGAITDNGPMDVATNPLDPADPTTEKIMNLNKGEDISISGKEPYATGFFPFILEKYIKVEPPAQDAWKSGPEIFGLDYWRTEVPNLAKATSTGTLTGKSLTPNIETLIAKGLAVWSYGLRISVVMPNDAFTNGGIPKEDFDNSILDSKAGETKSLKFGENWMTRKFVIPVATAEVPIDTPESLTLDLIDRYDLNCMISELMATPEYKTLFNYCFPLQSLLSLVTIYTIETFLLSIGEEWEEEANVTSQFKRWDKEGNFKKTKKNLRRLFEGFYRSRDSNYKDEEIETSEEQTRKKIKVKKSIPTDADIKWWQKKLQVPKPAEECE